MKTPKMLFLSIAVLLLMGAAQGAFAHDHFYDWADHWQDYVPGTTTQAWEYGGHQGPPTYNPYGTAQQYINGGIQTSGGILMGGTGGSISTHIPNNPVENPYKLMYIQVTASKATNGPPNIGAPGTVTTTPGDIYFEGGTTYTYTWLTRIEPNPAWEDITLNFYPDTLVEEIVIDTICVVPEPSSLATLLASGLFTGVFALRRRRR